MIFAALTTFLQASASPGTVIAAVGLFLTLVALVSGGITGYVASSNAARRFEATIETTVKLKFEAVDREIERLRAVDRDQWKEFQMVKREIANNGQRIAKVETRCEDRESC